MRRFHPDSHGAPFGSIRCGVLYFRQCLSVSWPTGRYPHHSSQYKKEGGGSMLNRLFNRIGSILGQSGKPRREGRRPGSNALRTARPVQRDPFLCVEVQPGNPACAAASRLAGTRFLPDDAPILPVTGCNSHSCQCGYRHHDDRREDDRRNAYRQWGIAQPELNGERRARQDRRRSADNAFKPTMAF